MARKYKKPGTISVEMDEQDFGCLCTCALRYCMGRETYMPSLIRDAIRPILPKIGDKALGVMIADCERQREYNDYGSETIDKPGWVKWEQELWAERDRRKTDG